MVIIGKHIITSDLSKRSPQEQSIMDRIHAWEEKLAAFKAPSPEWQASVDAYAEWRELPDNKGEQHSFSPDGTSHISEDLWLGVVE